MKTSESLRMCQNLCEWLNWLTVPIVSFNKWADSVLMKSKQNLQSL